MCAKAPLFKISKGLCRSLGQSLKGEGMSALIFIGVPASEKFNVSSEISDRVTLIRERILSMGGNRLPFSCFSQESLSMETESSPSGFSRFPRRQADMLGVTISMPLSLEMNSHKGE